ncbi:Disease resistance response protein 206 [Apostasia shenzhenica]|uniref:Dirigent protein n=1 Tax=Apostasia shenzhenica TaxID=1088818 RepID=A0A2I0AMR6_9ASPA|nr:Disease resistance response protein 206 [Apostasia shenzhenica]
MARLLHLLLFLSLSYSAAGWATTTSSPPAKKLLEEKLTHLHFFFHDVISGPNATAFPVTGPVRSAGRSAFGRVTMIDDLLTAGPDPTSRPVGRAQGFYAAAELDELGFLMVMSLAFSAGKYNGSVLSVVGRNQPWHPVREMAVVGGSGVFRLARGFALARTHSLRPSTAIVEYNVSVIHY